MHARKAVELSPQDGLCRSTLALAEYRSGHWDASLAAAERSIELKDTAAAVNWLILAMGHWQKGEKDRARTWFDKAATAMKPNPPRSGNMRRLWAEAAELLGRPGPEAVGPAKESSNGPSEGNSR